VQPLFAHPSTGELLAILLLYVFFYVVGPVVAATITLAIATAVLLVGSLLGGGILTALVKKKRHPFWLLPLLNVGLYFLCYPLITVVAGVYLGARFDLDVSHPLKPAGLYMTLLSVPLIQQVDQTTPQGHAGAGNGGAGNGAGPDCRRRVVDYRRYRLRIALP